jgi:uncharacterized membrane protein
MLICVATSVGWSLCTFGPESISMPVPDVSPHRQFIYMLHHPFLILYMESRMLLAVPFISSIIGQLGLHEIRLWFPLTVLYFCVLYYTTRIGGWPDRQMTLRQRKILAAAVLGCWVAVFSLVYLMFTPVGARSINGLQGRYMIPVAAPFFLMFYRAPRPRHGNPGAFITAFAGGFAVYALLVLLRAFYIW